MKMNPIRDFEIPADMERVQKIIGHPEFKKSMEMIKILEKDRIFCGHNMTHLLDVARIAWIDCLETSAAYPKDVVYGAGLLHDVGKYLQYTEGTGHHVTSERIARQVLKDAGYEAAETEDICQAILSHRDKKASGKTVLGRILYRADKISRACYVCPAAAECDWSTKKKTAGVIS